MSDRTTLALPIDVVRTLDHTVTQTQLSNNTFQGTPDDRDMLSSLIEDAEDELRAQTNLTMRLSRAGTPGQKETYDHVTYSLPGHETYKRQWSRVGGDYLNQEIETSLSHDRILPFDSAEGDEAYFYRGLSGSASGDEWEDVTDEFGDSWFIVDHRDGTIVFHPQELDRAMVGNTRGVSFGNQSQLRFAISYRFGSLGGTRSDPGAATLDTSLTNTETGTVAITDADQLPTGGSGGSIVLLVNEEYLRATVDPQNDQLDIVERGVRGTSGAAHSSGDRVQYAPPAVRKAVAARAGMGLVQSGRYSAYLPDSDDTLDKGDVLDEQTYTWEKTLEALV